MWCVLFYIEFTRLHFGFSRLCGVSYFICGFRILYGVLYFILGLLLYMWCSSLHGLLFYMGVLVYMGVLFYMGFSTLYGGLLVYVLYYFRWVYYVIRGVLFL